MRTRRRATRLRPTSYRSAQLCDDCIVGRYAPDGTCEPLFENLVGLAPKYIVRADGDLYWSGTDGNVYHVTASGALETILAQDRHGYAFAVLPDEILVEFTRSGFRSMPR